MEDVEAEAVLLALADPLVWNTNSDRSGARARKGFYDVMALPLQKRIGRRTRYYRARWHLRTEQRGHYETDTSPYRYEHKADGRAACERHHATGKWE